MFTASARTCNQPMNMLISAAKPKCSLIKRQLFPALLWISYTKIRHPAIYQNWGGMKLPRKLVLREFLENFWAPKAQAARMFSPFFFFSLKDSGGDMAIRDQINDMLFLSLF